MATGTGEGATVDRAFPRGLPPPTPLEFERTDGDAGRVRLAIAGEVDFSNSDTVQQAISKVIAEPGVTCLRVDLARLRFIDTSGARSLITCKRAADQRRIGFRVVNPARAVVRVLQILGVDGMLAPGDEAT
jgi:anti-sigma B factor antagonist